MKIKLILTTLVLSLLVGCGTLTGNYTKTPMLDQNGNLVTNILGAPVYTVTRQSRTAAVSEKLSAAIPKNPTKRGNQCESLTFEQVNQFSEAVRLAYFDAVKTCSLGQSYANLAAVTLNRPISDADAIAREVTKSVIGIEKESTAKFKAVVNPLAVTITAKAAFDGIKDVGVAAAKTGNTSVGSISVSDSGDTGGSGGEAGAAGAFTPNGSTNINIGDGNSNNTAQGSSTAANNNLQPEGSSSGSITEDSKTQGAQTAETIDDGAQVDDDDGLNL